MGAVKKGSPEAKKRMAEVRAYKARKKLATKKLATKKPAAKKPAAKKAAPRRKSPLAQVQERVGERSRCEFCHAGFKPRVVGQRFCCTNCRNKWHYHSARGHIK